MLRRQARNLLLWSQHYTQTDMLYLTKGGFWLTLGHVVSGISYLFLAVAFANLLPKATFGIYRYALSIMGIIAVFTLPGMDTAVTRAIANGDQHSVVSATKAKFRWGLLGSLLSFILGGFYYFKGDLTLASLLCIIALLLPITHTLSIYNAILAGKKLFKTTTRYQILGQLANTVSIITVLLITNSVVFVLLAHLVSLAILRTVFFRKAFPHLLRSTTGDDGQTVSYGKHLSSIAVLGTVADQFDRLLVFHVLGPVDLATYAFARAPIESLKAPLKNVHTLALPKFANKTKEELKKTIFRKIRTLLILTSLIATVYILIAPFMFKLLFPVYVTSAPLSQFYALSLVVSGGLPQAFLESQMAIKHRYTLAIFSSSTKIILVFVLTLNYGLWGVVVAICASKFISYLFAIYLLKRV